MCKGVITISTTSEQNTNSATIVDHFTHTQNTYTHMEKTTGNRGSTFSVNTIPKTSSEVAPRLEVLNRNDNAGSKKLLKTDNDFHSSTIAVLENDDLLIEILLRLPVLSLLLFKSVSKQWLSLITSPDFTLRREKIPKIDPPAGLLILRETFERNTHQLLYDFESFDIRIPSKRSTDFTLGFDAPPGFVHILQSCNGLLLCCTLGPDKLYVCNPTIQLFKMLPTNSPLRSVRNVKIAFDPTMSPHYKVIHAMFVDYVDYDNGLSFRICQIETYSSETGNWSFCGDTFPGHSFSQFNDAIYWNDALHWLITDDDVCSHCNLLVVSEQPVLTKTELPRTFGGKLFESGGSLLLLSQENTYSRKLKVSKMKNGCCEWSVKYIVNLNDIMMPFTWRTKDRVRAIVLGEKEEDSFMIIHLLSKVVQYNPKLKTLRTFYDLESTGCYSMHAYQFIPSFAAV